MVEQCFGRGEAVWTDCVGDEVAYYRFPFSNPLFFFFFFCFSDEAPQKCNGHSSVCLCHLSDAELKQLLGSGSVRILSGDHSSHCSHLVHSSQAYACLGSRINTKIISIKVESVQPLYLEFLC